MSLLLKGGIPLKELSIIWLSQVDNIEEAIDLENGITPPALDPKSIGSVRSASVLLPEGVPFLEGTKEQLKSTVIKNLSNNHIVIVLYNRLFTNIGFGAIDMNVTCQEQTFH